jgi:4-amino-4-deoxy-L-arabinose transferase-like glycosyltransferase
MERRTAFGLLLLALLARVGFVLMLKPGFYFEDSLDYDRAARSFLATGAFDAGYYRFPLYPLLMAASYHLFGPSLVPFRILQAILGTLTCAVVWRLARAQFGKRTGILVLLGLAISRPTFFSRASNI